ncbi:segregation/condensation protein A [Candidatus Bathyarchaeota archaeon]|nr:segregation/condensation protein A [Candidatus Bathyarchaeota archaeon]
MSTAVRKPFYLRPPWNILFELNKLEKLKPWNVNISYLLRSFLSEMEHTGKVDFRASGVALDSSALIYLMKSKLLLTLQEPPPPPKPPPDFIPPPLFLPLRHELTSTTIQNLLDVLDEVLKGEKLNRLDKVVSQPVLPAVTDLLPQFDAFLAELEARMQTLYELLLEKVKGAGIIEFSTIIKGADRIEAVRTFILLLFLAQEAKVSLWQNEETEELYIAVGNLNVAKDERTTR